MRVGAIISADGSIVPLPDGPIIRLRDTATGETVDMPNPAFGKETDRRANEAKLVIPKALWTPWYPKNLEPHPLRNRCYKNKATGKLISFSVK